MDQVQHHQEVLAEAKNLVSMLFEHSTQGMYLYLDDTHVTFSNRLLKMLGYTSDAEVLAGGKPMLEKLVAPASRPKLVDAYQRAMKLMTASSVLITWITKTKVKLKTTVILVPLAFEGHLFALHFVDEIQPKSKPA